MPRNCYQRKKVERGHVVKGRLVEEAARVNQVLAAIAEKREAEARIEAAQAAQRAEARRLADERAAALTARTAPDWRAVPRSKVTPLFPSLPVRVGKSSHTLMPAPRKSHVEPKTENRTTANRFSVLAK